MFSARYHSDHTQVNHMFMSHLCRAGACVNYISNLGLAWPPHYSIGQATAGSTHFHLYLALSML